MLVSKYYETLKLICKYLIKHTIKMNYFLHLILISLQFSKDPEGMNKYISIEAGSIVFKMIFFHFGKNCIIGHEQKDGKCRVTHSLWLYW